MKNRKDAGDNGKNRVDRILGERRKQEERSKKILKEVTKTGKEFEEEIKSVTSAEEHIAKAERMSIGTDKTLQSSEKRIRQTEKEVGKTHEYIKEARTSGAEKEYVGRKKSEEKH